MKQQRSTTAIFVFLAALVVVGSLFSYSRKFIPRFDDFKDSFTTSERLLLDRNGQNLQEIRYNNQVRRFNWTPLEEISLSLVENVILAEDKRFYSHFGVDWRAIGSAVFHKLKGQSRGGASTVTMQLTEFLDSLNGKMKRRTYVDKLRQLFKAYAIELTWSKNQILEAYLNLLHFKGELQGVAASAYGLFEKNPANLDLEESVVLTVLIRAPNANPEKIFVRSCHQIKNVDLNQPCSDHLFELSKLVSRKIHAIKPLAQDAPQIAQQIKASGLFKDHKVVQTTLDLRIQKLTAQALHKQIMTLKNQNMNDGAAVVLDNQTGEIIAYVGNIGEDSSAMHVDGARALRQAGSTLKPFLYALGFDKKLISPATIIEDSPLNISVQSGLYRPQNYDRSFRSFVTARNSLASSLNIPAVKVVEMVGVPDFVSKLNDLGFSDLQRGDFYGPSIALGSADVKLIELANAYRTLANGGVWSPTTYLKTTRLPSRRVFSEEASYLISNILSDREARSSTFGLENMLSTRFWTAVKTGTSKDMRDNWCVGYSSRYTVAVWAGNFSGESMWSVTGIQGAAPVWIEIMNALHAAEPSIAPVAPSGILTKSVTFPQWKLTKVESFIRGTEPQTDNIIFETQPLTKILYPQEGSFVAIDPDIPMKNQKVFFNFGNPTSTIRIQLNGTDLGPAQSFFLWTPQIGKYHLKLVDDVGVTIDQVHFEVRGKNLPVAKN